MKRSAKQYNVALSRVAFWQGMTARLAEFESLVQHREHLRLGDVRALNGCNEKSKDKQSMHKKE